MILPVGRLPPDRIEHRAADAEPEVRSLCRRCTGGIQIGNSGKSGNRAELLEFVMLHGKPGGDGPGDGRNKGMVLRRQRGSG